MAGSEGDVGGDVGSGCGGQTAITKLKTIATTMTNNDDDANNDDIDGSDTTVADRQHTTTSMMVITLAVGGGGVVMIKAVMVVTKRQFVFRVSDNVFYVLFTCSFSVSSQLHTCHWPLTFATLIVFVS